MLRVLHVHQRQAFSSIPVQQVSRGHAGFKVQGPAASHWQVKGHNHFLVIKEKNISSSTTNREKLENVATQNASAQPCSEADIEKNTKVYVDEPTAELCVDEQTFAHRTVIASTESGPKPSSVDIKDPIEKRLVDFSVNSSSLADKASSQSLVDPGVSDLVQKNKRPESLEILNTGEITSSEDLPPKRIVQPVHNFAAVVNKSETLANLVRLGVDLSQMEANRDAADLLVRLDFDEDIKPVLLFLHDVGVASDKMGTIITKYPLILRSSLEDMRTHIDYFRSKNFPAEAISYIITKAPRLFGMSVMEIDTNLGVYQQEFKLTGSEVQQVATKLPKLVSWNTGKIQDARFYMLEFLGFSKAELKQIFLTCPKVLLIEKLRLGKKFDYLYNDMKLTHKALVSWPRVFLASQMLLQQRHQFLKKLGRDQFDPTKENYVSLRDLVTRRDRDFCFHVAKSSVSQYNDFLKTL